MDKAEIVFTKLGGLQAEVYRRMKGPILKMLNSRKPAEMLTNIDNVWKPGIIFSGGRFKNMKPILNSHKSSKIYEDMVDRAVTLGSK